MRREHRDIQTWIHDRYHDTYNVAVEIHGKNTLPDRQRHWYQPDVVLRGSGGQIAHIIEIENDPVRKALVGASILADRSVAELKQTTKPRLIFVVYSEDGIRQLHNFVEKIGIAREYCTHLRDIEIYSEVDFKALAL